jgi:D-alanyl-D-alanine carboxypeptidase
MRREIPLLLAVTMLAAVAMPCRAQAPAVPQPELVRRLTALLDSLTAADAFSGVVALARDGAPVFEHAYGYADRATKRPNRIDTAFNLGSIDKVFTATAIRQLAAAGRLDVDSSLGHYWPDYPNPAVRRVTIRQLLEFRSGIGGDIFGEPAGGSRHDIRSNQGYLPLFVNEPLLFEPGTQRRYSNAGYVVLGLLVARVSGEDYYDYVRDHVTGPVGMWRTAWYPVDSLPSNTAIGYTRADSTGRAYPGAPLRANTALLPGRGSAAGGGYSTAHDLLAFLAALRESRVPGGPPAGLGVAGGAPGLNATLDGALPGGYDLVVLANLDPPAAEPVARRVRGWLGARD